MWIERATVLLLALLLAGCELPPTGWHRVDLARLEPRVESLPIDSRPGPDAQSSADDAGLAPSSLELLGSGVHNPHHPPAPEPRIGARVRTRSLPAGRVLAYSVPLGRHPRLSFVPAEGGSPDCRLRYRAGVRSEGTLEVLVDHRPPPGRPLAAPAPVEVDLGPWARRTVELLLWAEAEREDGREGCATASDGIPDSVWASPAVYGIGPVPRRLGSTEKPNVLLIGVDTLRADHLGAYGRSPSPSPAFDRLAGSSDLWLEAFSAFNVTNPSFASIHTGLYGKNHGIYNLYTPLPSEHTTLAERYQEAGYRTFGVVAAGHLRGAASGLDQGFEALGFPAGQYTAETVVDQGMEWISGLEQGPFFLWLHFFDPHTPHTPPLPWADGLLTDGHPGLGRADFWRPFRPRGVPEYDNAWLGGHRQLYLSEVAYFDRQLDRLLDFLDSRGLLETTWIALVADHGENLGEHEVTYQHAGLWDATLHVPLLIRPPGPRDGREGRRLGGLVQSIDLYPTLLRLTGIDDRGGEDQGVDGRDLYRLTTDGVSGRRLVFAEEPHEHGRMVRDRDHIYFWVSEEHSQLRGSFFLRTDDLETNLLGQGLEEEARLRELLERWWNDRREAPEAIEGELDPEERQQLMALGYIDP